VVEPWESQALDVVVPIASARRMCEPGARRGGVAATFARRDERAARIVVWGAAAAGGGAADRHGRRPLVGAGRR
jgi:hypothetical protein